MIKLDNMPCTHKSKHEKLVFWTSQIKSWCKTNTFTLSQIFSIQSKGCANKLLVFKEDIDNIQHYCFITCFSTAVDTLGLSLKHGPCESIWHKQLSVKVQLGYLLVFAHSTRGKDSWLSVLYNAEDQCNKPNTGVTNRTGHGTHSINPRTQEEAETERS